MFEGAAATGRVKARGVEWSVFHVSFASVESLIVGGRKVGVDIEKKWLVVNKQGQVPVSGERRVRFSKAFWDRECL